MKKIFYLPIVCFFYLLFGLMYADAYGADLFLDSPDTIQTDITPVDQAIIIRQRPVHIRFDLLAFGDAETIVFNLFDDIRLTGIRDHIERNTSNGYAWIGHAEGIEGGQITLVVEDQKMACTITLPEMFYHVRHVENQNHVVREIDPSAFSVSPGPPGEEIFLAALARSTEENEVLYLMNLEREAVGLQPYTWDERLFEAARGHSVDMANQGYFSHTSLDGRTFSQRITNAGYIWNTCGENIAYGYSSPQAVVNAWMNSSGHRDNILNASYCDVGVGHTPNGHYWTQDFGRERGVSSCPVESQNQAPIANFTANPTSGEAPLTVQFDASSSSDTDGSIVAYDWNFGDGAGGSGIEPSHTYTSGGTFSARLTVTDSSGATGSKTATITVTENVPVTLSSLSISGDNSVIENSSSNYTATATFSDGSTLDVTDSADWSEDSPFASITSGGTLNTSDVPGDMEVTIEAGYEQGGITETATKVVTIVHVPEDNAPPNPPIITYPGNGDDDIGVPLNITANAFSDPNSDSHSKSQWQISEQSNFSSLLVDISSNSYLTTFSVPHSVLKSKETYYVRLRYYDAYSESSGWSGSVGFTTDSFFVDGNSNGIPDDDEVDDSVDFNLDDIPDNNQPQVIKCVLASDGSTEVGVEKISSSIVEIETLEVIDPATVGDTENRPNDLIFGLISFRLRMNQPGATALLKVYCSGGLFDSDTVMKYDTISGWYNFQDHVTANSDDNTITLELKDGGFGDSDRLANGIIVDPMGVAAGEGTSAVGAATNTGGSGGGGGCFIATAAFGSKLEGHVQILREFRDAHLMTHRIGLGFVEAYYTYSPPLADFIAQHDTLRRLVRSLLIPIVGMSWVTLQLGFTTTLTLLLLFCACLIGLPYFCCRCLKNTAKFN